MREIGAQGGGVIKNIANIITAFRIAAGVALVFTVPFSAAFWCFYLTGGLSDMLDGKVARMLNRQSEAGAKFDSAADLVFGLGIAVVLITNFNLPAWAWGCAAFVAALKIASYCVGAYKYRAFSALHTRANKTAGIFLFAFPLLFKALGLEAACALLCLVTFGAAVEELIITARSDKLDRNCKGLFFK